MRMSFWTAAMVAVLGAVIPCTALAQAPKANGETLNIQNYAGTTGNLHAVIAKHKGLCDKYNFKCELKTINSGILGLQALVGKTIDVAQTGTELTASTINAGGDVAIVGISLPANVSAAVKPIPKGANEVTIQLTPAANAAPANSAEPNTPARSLVRMFIAVLPLGPYSVRVVRLLGCFESQ